jgi:hypothetical protein
MLTSKDITILYNLYILLKLKCFKLLAQFMLKRYVADLQFALKFSFDVYSKATLSNVVSIPS